MTKIPQTLVHSCLGSHVNTELHSASDPDHTGMWIGAPFSELILLNNILSTLDINLYQPMTVFEVMVFHKPI